MNETLKHFWRLFLRDLARRRYEKNLKQRGPCELGSKIKARPGLTHGVTEWRTFWIFLDLSCFWFCLILFTSAVNFAYFGCSTYCLDMSWSICRLVWIQTSTSSCKKLQKKAMSIQNQKNNHNFHQIIALEDSTDKMRQTCCIILSFKTTRCHSWGIQKTQGGAVWFSFPRCDSRVFAARFWSS